MNINKVYPEKLIESLNSNLEKYDIYINTLNEKSDDEIIFLKKDILVESKYLIENTVIDLIALKNNIPKDISKFENKINEVYKKLLNLIIHPYICEVRKINNSLKPSVFINSISFNPYVNILSILLKNISSFECQIKSKIESFLSVIIKNKVELELFKNKVISQSFSERFTQIFTSKDNFKLKISLIDLDNNKETTNHQSEIDNNHEGFTSNDLTYEDFINKAIQEMKT